MAGLDLAAIHAAVATQIRAQTTRDINVADHPKSQMPLPVVEVWPGNPPYVDYALSYGTTGIATVNLRIRVEITAQDAPSVFVQMSAYLSAGTAHTSSIYDALKADTTFGGVVNSLQTMTAEWDPGEDDTTSVAWIPLQLTVSKT